MSDSKPLAKVLNDVSKTGKYVIGQRQVLKAIKGTKLVVYSSSMGGERASALDAACESASVPVLRFEGSSLSLGRLLGKSFRVSALSIKSAGDADLSPLLELKNVP